MGGQRKVNQQVNMAKNMGENFRQQAQGTMRQHQGKTPNRVLSQGANMAKQQIANLDIENQYKDVLNQILSKGMDAFKQQLKEEKMLNSKFSKLAADAKKTGKKLADKHNVAQ